MVKLNLVGTLGKYGYAHVAEAMSKEIVLISTEQAYITAKKSAPYDPTPDGKHIRDDLVYDFNEKDIKGTVRVKDNVYALVAEYGSKHRLKHPYMRPGASAAKSKMKAIIRKTAKDTILKGKNRGNG